MPRQTSLSDRRDLWQIEPLEFWIRDFGQSVLKPLQDQDVDIIAIDDHEDVINQYESMITTGIVGDITEMDPLRCGRYWGTVTQSSLRRGENLEIKCPGGHEL